MIADTGDSLLDLDVIAVSLASADTTGRVAFGCEGSFRLKCSAVAEAAVAEAADFWFCYFGEGIILRILSFTIIYFMINPSERAIYLGDL